MLVLLDSGPLGALANPSTSSTAGGARAWATTLIERGDQIVVPEIADYEVRRELVRIESTDGLRRLDELGAGMGYVPLTTTMWRRAAELWADARSQGRPTASDPALDGDVLLAAQALALEDEHGDVIVATTNTRHLERYVRTALWDHLG